MRTILKNSFYALALLFMVSATLQSCKTESDPALTVADILSGETWNVLSVIHDTEGDLTDHYTGFAMQFTKGGQSGNYDGTYTISNSAPIFQGDSGQWKITEGSSSNKLEFDNGMVMDAVVTETTLVLTFTSSINGKIGGLDGGYVFTLKR